MGGAADNNAGITPEKEEEGRLSIKNLKWQCRPGKGLASLEDFRNVSNQTDQSQEFCV